MPRRFSLALVVLLFVSPCISPAQTIQNLVNQPPAGAQTLFLLTDGTVLAQGYAQRTWYKLTPDITGSYVNGTWSRVADMPFAYAPYATAQAVLADGRVVVIGGEYINFKFTLSNEGAIYDPVANTWTNVRPPASWPYIGDSPSVVLPDGTFLVGDKLMKSMAILDPKTLQWTTFSGQGKADINAEEGWTLLPNGSVLTEDVVDNPNSEIFNPATRTWTSAGSTVADLASPGSRSCTHFGPNGSLCYYPVGEVGPAILRPDGTVFVGGALEGSVTHTAIYDTNMGTWAAGPDFPNGDDSGDGFAVLEPNGNVLVEGRLESYEWDGTNLNATILSNPGALIVLPTGQVLDAGFPVQVYTPTGTYQSSWAPTIASVPSSVTRGQTYKVSGTQFNGLSQAAAVNDELEQATNYPLVRITNNASGHVCYAHTHDHSTMAVATGSLPVFTYFDVPHSAETGASTLEVVANGIPSSPVSITVH